jgi:hypothetical protein
MDGQAATLSKDPAAGVSPIGMEAATLLITRKPHFLRSKQDSVPFEITLRGFHGCIVHLQSLACLEVQHLERQVGKALLQGTRPDMPSICSAAEGQ